MPLFARIDPGRANLVLSPVKRGFRTWLSRSVLARSRSIRRPCLGTTQAASPSRLAPLRVLFARCRASSCAIKCDRMKKRTTGTCANSSQPHLPVNRGYPLERHHERPQQLHHDRTAKPQKPDQDSLVAVHAQAYDCHAAVVNARRGPVGVLPLCPAGRVVSIHRLNHFAVVCAQGQVRCSAIDNHPGFSYRWPSRGPACQTSAEGRRRMD